MTWRRGDRSAAPNDITRINRLTCEGNDGYRKSTDPAAKSWEVEPISCPAMITIVATATIARTKARQQGWETRATGDRCPKHRITHPRTVYPEGSPRGW